MKVKLTFPVPGRQSQVGHIIDIDPQKAKVWIENDWCVEVDNDLPLVEVTESSDEFPVFVEGIKEKVKHVKKPAKEQ